MGQISIWSLDANLNYLTSKVYGPFFGFDPHAAALAGRPLDGSSTSSDQAAEAMKPKVPATPMP